MLLEYLKSKSSQAGDMSFLNTPPTLWTLSRPSGCPRHNCWSVVLGGGRQTRVGLSRRATYTLPLCSRRWPPHLLFPGRPPAGGGEGGGQIGTTGKLRLYLGTISRGSVHYKAKLMLVICYPICPYLEIEIFACSLACFPSEISNNVFRTPHMCFMCCP